MPIKPENKNISNALIYVLCNPNNTIISVTNAVGNCILNKSSGSKFHGNQKTTPFASQSIMSDIIKILKEETKITSKGTDK